MSDKAKLDEATIDMVAAISHEARREYRARMGISEQNTGKLNPQPWEFISPPDKAKCVERVQELVKKPKSKNRPENEGLIFDVVAKALLSELK